MILDLYGSNIDLFQEMLSSISKKTEIKRYNVSKNSIGGSSALTSNTIESVSCSPKRKISRALTCAYSKTSPPPSAEVQIKVDEKAENDEIMHFEDSKSQYPSQKLNGPSKETNKIQRNGARSRTHINSGCTSFRSIIEEIDAFDRSFSISPPKFESPKVNHPKNNSISNQKSIIEETKRNEPKYMEEDHLENQITPKRKSNTDYKPDDLRNKERKSPDVLSVNENFELDCSKEIQYYVKNHYEDRSYLSIPKASNRLSIASNLSINSNVHQDITNEIIGDLTSSVKKLSQRLIKSEEIAYETLVEHVRLLNSIKGLENKIEEQKRNRIEKGGIKSGCSNQCLLF
ncbi:hypothetical protein SteCoe_24860 [Stentor coeruleus]|uniref:Uncharacterized protein n=1 Tax=Stentor coeruleus TaxID=5963 RepID=A0A1R2BGN2_9CILI|nr:hypothetical protein SteCoe_24860 [Stentor coeruleus]